MNRSYVTILGSALFGAVIGAAILEGLQRPPSGGFCEKPKHHCIKVTVDATDPNAPVLRVDSDVLMKKGKNRVIHWIIDNESNQSYVFTADAATAGIEFKSGDGGNAEFTCSLDTQDDPKNHTYECKDPNGGPSTPPAAGFKYKVTVATSAADKIPGALDPKIFNN